MTEGMSKLFEKICSTDKNAENYKLTCVQIVERLKVELESPTTVLPKRPIPEGFDYKPGMRWGQGACKYPGCNVVADGTRRDIVHKASFGWCCADHFDCSSELEGLFR